MLLNGEEMTKYSYDYRAMQSVLSEGVRRGELRDDLPTDELALFFNAELYGLMIAWCMTDGDVAGTDKTDVFCNTVIKAALEPYRQS